MTGTGVQRINAPRAAEFYTVHGDRKPWLIPLADGWEWYRYSDGMLSTRWVTDGTVNVCTHCGMEYTNRRSVPGHNRSHPEIG